MRPFTIETFFIDGDPSGVRSAEIRTKPVLAYYIPRKSIKKACSDNNQLSWNGVYTLFNGNDSDVKQEVYIGEAENVGNRLNQHNCEKESWWNVAIVFVINNEAHQLSKADIKYLENLMYSKAKKYNNMKLKNANTPHQSFVTKPREYDLKEIFENIDLLLRSLGYPLFYDISKVKVDNYVYLNGRDANGKGIYTNEGLLVKKGSRLSPKDPIPSFDFSKVKRLQEAGIITNDVFIKDYMFNSPSAASDILCKGSSNGWTSWHDKNDKTLDEIYR